MSDPTIGDLLRSMGLHHAERCTACGGDGWLYGANRNVPCDCCELGKLRSRLTAWIDLTRRLVDATGALPLGGQPLTDEESEGIFRVVKVAQEAMVALQSVGIGDGLPAPVSTPVIAHTLQDEVAQWTAATFPNSTPATTLAHLRKEVKDELTEACEPDEVAGAYLLLLSLANFGGFSLEAEARTQFAVNKTRTWGKPNAEGFVEHVR